MVRGIHLFLLVAGLVGAMASALRAAPGDPLTPVELAKTGSIFANQVFKYSPPSSLQGAPMNLPPTMSFIAFTQNGMQHDFGILPDGGLVLELDYAGASCLFRLDPQQHLVASTILKNGKLYPVPDPIGGVRSELAYWAAGADANGPEKLPPQARPR